MHNRTLHALLAAIAILAMVGLSACKQAEEPATEGGGEETSAGQEATAEGDEAAGDETTGDEATGDEADDTAAAEDAPMPLDPVAAGDGPSLDALAAALPADTMLVAMVDMNALLTTATPGGDDSIRTDLRKDIGALFMQHYKFDPSQAPWVGFAAGSGEWMGLIVGGKVATDGMETTEIAGKQAWVVKQGVSVMIDLGGLSVITAQPMAEKLLGDNGPKLSGAPQFAAMKGAVGELGSTGGLTVAGYLEPELVQSMRLPIPPALVNLDAFAVSLDQKLEIVTTGTPEEITAMSTLWSTARDTFVAEVNREYEGRATRPLDEQLGVITAKHAVDGLVAAWEPTFEGGVARLVIDPAILKDSAGYLIGAMAAGYFTFSSEPDIAPVAEEMAPGTELVAPEPVEAPAPNEKEAQQDDANTP